MSSMCVKVTCSKDDGKIVRRTGTMFGIKREKLISSLKKIQEKLCAYTKQPCDCKYIKDDDKHICSMSESGSGCPEVTMAFKLIESMTQKEFDRLVKRAKILIWDKDDNK